MEIIRVLFVCEGNDCVSPMAEGFLKRHGGVAFDVVSAGIHPKPLDATAVDVMHRSGIDISAHPPTAVAELADRDFDFVINVSEASRDAVIGVTNTHRLIHWRFPDPRDGGGTDSEVRRRYQRVRDEVAGRVRLFAYAQTRRRERGTRDSFSLAG
ncbi:MAG TPA: arsenate reductase ArsC [Candidatus Eisenbacteria bacterium]